MPTQSELFLRFVYINLNLKPVETHEVVGVVVPAAERQLNNVRSVKQQRD